jgi:Fe-S-cluster-containing dehydrogenase component
MASLNNGFIFDYAKCVGCHACITACCLENKTKYPVIWRQINSYNSKKIPLAGFIHLSIACNHCSDAPCLKACPAVAYRRDLQTDTVIHFPDKCIGCKYCTWACPYDAPKFNVEKGIIEKCTLCNHRIAEGLPPACANLCPTGALSYGFIDKNQTNSIGVSNREISPKINTLRSNVVDSIPEMDVNASGYNCNNIDKTNLFNIESKIESLHEWPLVLFTFIASLLTGMITSTKLEESFILKVIFSFLALVGLFLSTFHLGQPLRAYRSILNYRTSWLSREIIAFGLFCLFSFIYLFIYSNSEMHFIVSFLGFSTLICIEMVYSITKKSYKTPIHSANTMLTAILFALVFNQLWKLALAIAVIKALLYLVRKGSHEVEITPTHTLQILIRFLIGLMLPIGLLTKQDPDYSIIIVPLLIVGELFDRFEYYDNLLINSPNSELNQILKERLNS